MLETALVSCDDHLDLNMLPADVWQKRMSAKWGDRTPQVHVPDSSEEVGRLTAVDVETGETVWSMKQRAGIGGALLAAAGFFAIFLFGWLLMAAFEGLNEAFAPWLSALLVSAFLLVVVLILALVGMSSIKKHKDLGDLQAVDSIKDDVNMVRGMGHAADGTDPLNDLDSRGFDTNGVQR